MEKFVLTPMGQKCLQQLLMTWLDFEETLFKVPIVARIEQQGFTIEDYQRLLKNLYPQVIEGARWISRCASSFDREHAHIRTKVIHHAHEEHRDYTILEKDYQAVGGNPSDLHNAKRNAGTEALHGFLMHRASQSNPVDMIGAMWIIEGLGNKMASSWAKKIQHQLNIDESATQFIRYHGDNDERHLQELYQLIDCVATDEDKIEQIVRTATVVGKLYQLQLQEVDNSL